MYMQPYNAVKTNYKIFVINTICTLETFKNA